MPLIICCEMQTKCKEKLQAVSINIWHQFPKPRNSFVVLWTQVRQQGCYSSAAFLGCNCTEMSAVRWTAPCVKEQIPAALYSDYCTEWLLISSMSGLLSNCPSHLLFDQPWSKNKICKDVVNLFKMLWWIYYINAIYYGKHFFATFTIFLSRSKQNWKHLVNISLAHSTLQPGF